MATQSSGYVFGSTIECDRLERQAALQGIETHLRHFRMAPDARILDAGCGSGVIARLLASHRPGGDVVGVDVNPGHVAYARDRAAAEGLTNLSFEVGDLNRLPFADASFDVIWSHFVLYFLPYPEAALREFRRVVRPGGTVLIALGESSYLMNFPEDPALQARLERVMPGLLDIRLARKLPLMLSAAGFGGISVEIELDRVHTVIGRVAPERRRNTEEMFGSSLSRIAEVLGGQAEADAFLADLLAYLDRPDTCSYSTLWVVAGIAPGA